MKSRLNLLLKLGIFLILLSLSFLIFFRGFVFWNCKSAETLTSRIEAVLPPRTPGDPQDTSDSAMPVLQLDGKDFCGLISVPAFGVKLPVFDTWKPSAVIRYPCRFWGTIYDGSLILGGSSQLGQFDFCSRLDLDDRIIITDLLGTEYTCRVDRIDRSSSADFARLSSGGYPLTLFAPDGFSTSYIIVRCSWTGS